MTAFRFHTASPVNLRGLGLNKRPVLPREIKVRLGAALGKGPFLPLLSPTFPSISKEPQHPSSLLPKASFPICRTEATVAGQRRLLGKGQLRVKILLALLSHGPFAGTLPISEVSLLLRVPPAHSAPKTGTMEMCLPFRAWDLC